MNPFVTLRKPSQIGGACQPAVLGDAGAFVRPWTLSQGRLVITAFIVQTIREQAISRLRQSMPVPNRAVTPACTVLIRTTTISKVLRHSLIPWPAKYSMFPMSR